MSISKEKKLSPMFECWTADRVWISFLFLTTWKLSHLIKTKFIENEKGVLKKKTSQKKKRRKEKKKKKKRNLSLTGFELAPLDEKYREAHIPSPQWLTVLRNKFFGFLYNYGIFNWT